jgi:ectoine hydroxylase-related dioxygenase (phytanoyl-CoA dioxygenase family)
LIPAVEERGFEILFDVFSSNEIEPLLRDLPSTDYQHSRAGIRHVLHNPAVAALARDSRMLGLARDILGIHALPFRATLFDKSSDSNWLITWHQDTALPLAERREAPGWGPWSVKEGVIYAHAPADALSQIPALRLHLDDCTVDNGPLRVLPGTHSMGVLSDDLILGLATIQSPVECLIPQGGVLAMRPLLVHASSKSQSQKPRRVLHIEYAANEQVGERMRLAIT